ncbi:MAG: hypothetical protein K9M10_03210 [Candidatus Pacebacteria bacterium]|nr:hypothetical protein [Candidatus Paceibacterota bacterium]MCF7857463.1 hypothetical protein [Candidatus Paceibacterota bacterium]
MRYIKNKCSGYLLVLVLVFGSVFFLITAAFIGYVITQAQVAKSNINKAQALNIAEAGLDYYTWFLAHYPGDTTNGTTTPGPYVHVYNDPEGAALGEFSLEIASSTACGEVYAIDITSTGNSYDNPNLKRVVYGRYARPTVSEYAYIINSNVWAGPDRTIIGPYHTNGVVRMDGTNNSTVTSGQESWVCDGSMSCAPGSNGSTVDGVYGDGPNSDLWNFPSPPVNFTGLTVDLSAMQNKAQNSGGVYIGPSGKYGYRIVFKSDGTVDVHKVNDTYNYWGFTSENGWQTERNVIKTTSFVGNYAIPSSCSIIYVEDKVWLEGVVKGRVTLAAADVDTAGISPSVILNSNITYANATSGLLAIAEQDILVGLVVPDDMTLNGIFVAQNGRFGRNHYKTSGTQDVDSTHDGYVERNSLTINGTIVSNGRVGTKWMSGATYLSGFDTRYNSYDRDLVSNPPPLTPEVSDTYRFIEWRDVD